MHHNQHVLQISYYHLPVLDKKNETEYRKEDKSIILFCFSLWMAFFFSSKNILNNNDDKSEYMTFSI